ncbi:hypothetical protein QQP08_026145 [Theobroma cacao]|nr:hypothetical protein QQP08_026145 [Theobroma cacao]
MERFTVFKGKKEKGNEGERESNGKDEQNKWRRGRITTVHDKIKGKQIIKIRDRKCGENNKRKEKERPTIEVLEYIKSSAVSAS